MPAETKWTPGPWTVQQERMAQLLVMAPNGMSVAEGVGSIFDAQVIAAAPDLYAALEDLVSVLDRLGALDMPRMRAARAALARARGEAP